MPSAKSEQVLIKHKKIGPILGGLLGGFPQCGFDAMAANLYSARIITMGTLIAVFLSTSDEMLPIMLNESAPFSLITCIICFKIVIGIIVGLAVDLIFYKQSNSKNIIKKFCHDEHCGCETDGIFISSLKHTVKNSTFCIDC